MGKPAALNVDMKGKVAIVTGATGGIGKEIARGLARMGATVVMTARTASKGDAVRDEIAQSTGSKSVSVMSLDVSDPASVRAFAKEFRAAHDKLHVLVNNAGAWFSDRRETTAGRELTFATNVLGPYLLTELLAEPLRAGAPARVVNLVSGLAANYDASDLDFRTRKYDGFKAYGQSKQALRMLTWIQAEKFKGSGVTANAAAPGFVRTDFNQNAHGFMAAMINFFARFMAVSPAEGADTPLWVSVAPELEATTAKYYDARKEQDGKFRDPAALAELEKLCAKMVGESGSSAGAASASAATG